jgi:hypothetical protein
VSNNNNNNNNEKIKIKIEALIEWLNISFYCLKDSQISKLSDLLNEENLEKILKEM